MTDDGALARLGRSCLWLLVVGLTAYLLLEVARTLYLVTIPTGVALLFTALLRPTAVRLRRRGVGRGAATAAAVLGFWVVLAALFYGVGLRAAAELPRLIEQTTTTIVQVQQFLARGPLHLADTQVASLTDRVVTYLRAHQATLTSGALTGAQVVAEVLTGLVLAVFLGLFLIYDGDRMWAWVLRWAVPVRHVARTDAFAHAAYHALSGYVRGQLLVGLFHGVVVAVTLSVMHVPLALPLAVLVGVGSLIPLVGAFVFGGLAVLVTLVTQGPILAAIMVGILVLENQAEAHLLQPFVVGRYVELHPVAIALVLTAGTMVAGVWGAIFAVPFIAAGNAGWKAIRGPELPALPAGQGDGDGSADPAQGEVQAQGHR